MGLRCFLALKKGIKKAPNLGRSACRLFIGVGCKCSTIKLKNMIVEIINHCNTKQEIKSIEVASIEEAIEIGRTMLKENKEIGYIVINTVEPKDKVTLTR